MLCALLLRTSHRRGLFFALGFMEPGVAQRVELRGWSAAMPIFTFLVVAAYALMHTNST
jgi:hypothetical protein